MKMRPRLALTAAAVTSLIVLSFCIPLGRLIQIVATNRELESAKLESRSLAGALGAVNDPTTLRQLVQQANAGNQDHITVYLADNTVLGDQIPVDPAVQLARQGRSFTAAAPGGGRDILVGVLVPGSGARVVRVRVPGSLLDKGVHEAWAVIAAIGLLVVLIAVGLADRLGDSIVAPMEDLLAVTRRLQGGDMAARAKPAGPPEVEEVGLAVNQLAERIGDLLKAEREASADLSHQLRTPLTVLRLDTEGLAHPGDRARLTTDIDRLEQVVTHVIEQSREGSRRVPAQGVSQADLGQVVRKRLAFWKVLAEDQGRQVDSTIPGGAQPVGVAGSDLDVCIDALVNNVLSHTPPETGFAVNVVSGGGGRWTLVVQDSGPGLPGNALPPRGRSSGGGTGLGLDIVRRAAEASGGSVIAGRGPEGGARIEVTFGPPGGISEPSTRPVRPSLLGGGRAPSGGGWAVSPSGSGGPSGGTWRRAPAAAAGPHPGAAHDPTADRPYARPWATTTDATDRQAPGQPDPGTQESPWGNGPGRVVPGGAAPPWPRPPAPREPAPRNPFRRRGPQP
ncbi:MAG: sensor histidine kinase [Acidimicrobiales bacterium]